MSAIKALLEQHQAICGALGLPSLAELGLGRVPDHDCHASPMDGCAACEEWREAAGYDHNREEDEE